LPPVPASVTDAEPSAGAAAGVHIGSADGDGPEREKKCKRPAEAPWFKQVTAERGKPLKERAETPDSSGTFRRWTRRKPG